MTMDEPELDHTFIDLSREAFALARPSLARARSEARLDLGYLLSCGELATSIRLGHLLRDHLADRRESVP
jgi:hypothetical protein